MSISKPYDQIELLFKYILEGYSKNMDGEKMEYVSIPRPNQTRLDSTHLRSLQYPDLYHVRLPIGDFRAHSLRRKGDACSVLSCENRNLCNIQGRELQKFSPDWIRTIRGHPSIDIKAGGKLYSIEVAGVSAEGENVDFVLTHPSDLEELLQSSIGSDDSDKSDVLILTGSDCFSTISNQSE